MNKLGTMDIYLAYEMVCDSIENDINTKVISAFKYPPNDLVSSFI